MSSKNRIILIFLSHISFSIIGMECIAVLDRKKLNEDKNRLLVALEEVNKEYGSKIVRIGTRDERELLLKKFIGSWKTRAIRPPFEKTFNLFELYLQHADISTSWMARWYEERKQRSDNPKIIAISAFREIIKKHLEKNLFREEPDQAQIEFASDLADQK